MRVKWYTSTSPSCTSRLQLISWKQALTRLYSQSLTQHTAKPLSLLDIKLKSPHSLSPVPHKHLMCLAQLVLWEVQLCFGNAHIRLDPRYELIQAAKPHLWPAPNRSGS